MEKHTSLEASPTRVSCNSRGCSLCKSTPADEKRSSAPGRRKGERGAEEGLDGDEGDDEEEKGCPVMGEGDPKEEGGRRIEDRVRELNEAAREEEEEGGHDDDDVGANACLCCCC